VIDLFSQFISSRKRAVPFRKAFGTILCGWQVPQQGEGGTGLELAIVKHIAQALGRKVTVACDPNRGSIFIPHLPV